ncbi:MAG TPA: TonB-dependent receptor, partial [Vicinamibacterales bacterium]|nr:TonB-dependent receptor [Vicinamibacterales bacterium]
MSSSPLIGRRHLRIHTHVRTGAGVGLLLTTVAVTAAAQPAPPPAGQPGLRLTLPTIIVTAQKEPGDKQKIPVSVTAVPKDTIDAAAIHIVSEASILAPNAFFTEATARKLSNARFRGIGASPGNPAITTYIDGVPQLNANSSSVELLDVEQIEFIRGPQSALFGRNTLGGLVNVWSARPSTSSWRGTVSAPFGNHGAWAVRGAAGGPIVDDKLSLGVAFAQVDRDGFTVNDTTGDDIDDRSAFSGKAQLLWLPNDAWEARVIVSGERARDGDYALNDVGALRANPFHASRDFEGRVDRDVFGTTILARRAAGAVTFSSTTGLLRWDTRDVTDLDYTPAPAVTRDNAENSFQFTQEIRLASAESSPVRLSDSAQLRWQSGVFLFTQDYEQDAINTYGPFVIAPSPAPVIQHSPRSALDDFGLGIFGHATVTLKDRLDISGGLRFDYENKNAVLESFFESPFPPPAPVDAEESFTNVSPQASVAFRLQPDRTVYATVSRGFKAGGFNPASPAGSESYGEELSWNVEGGVKTLWAEGRVSANAAVFFIDWNDLQLNVPDPLVPAQFYIANVGGATSKGVEVEVGARVAPGVDLFTAVGFTHARFGAGAVSSGVDVDGNTIPNTPDYTTSAGLQYTRSFGSTSVVGRADAVFYGAFQYDDLNTMEQDAYSLVNIRLAVTRGPLVAELLIRNAFDTEYIPFAFPYPAPSGFIGEMGAPRTVSFGIGVRF